MCLMCALSPKISALLTVKSFPADVRQKCKGQDTCPDSNKPMIEQFLTCTVCMLAAINQSENM